MQKILVIDDDRDMCLLLKKFLTSHGFNVSVAYNSKQALEILEVFRPDLVLCDFRLDMNDGKTMLVKIKEKGVVDDLQKIVDDEDTMHAVKDEAYSAIMKLS